MATFIDVDSQFREYNTYPNPASFTITAPQVSTWFSFNRTTRAYAQNPVTAPLDFASTVKIDSLIIPYVVGTFGTTNIDFSVIPKLYVDFHSKNVNSLRLIQAINGNHADARFVCSFDKFQTDDANNRVWIHYRCGMEQVMRFRKNSEMQFEVSQRDGTPLPLDLVDTGSTPNPLYQVMATFEITPYLNDGDYDNQNITPININ
jgi:hypothetical protein